MDESFLMTNENADLYKCQDTMLFALKEFLFTLKVKDEKKTLRKLVYHEMAIFYYSRTIGHCTWCCACGGLDVSN